MEFSTSPPSTSSPPPPLRTPLPASTSPLFPPANRWNNTILGRLRIIKARIPTIFEFCSFPDDLITQITEALSESARVLKTTWEWELPGDKTASQNLFAALGTKIYGHSARMAPLRTLQIRPAIVKPQGSSSQVSPSSSPILASSNHSSFHLSSSQIVQDAHLEIDDGDTPSQGEPRSEHILHAFMRTCVRLMHRFYGANNHTLQVDSRHLYYSTGSFSAINDGSVIWYAKMAASDGGIDEVEIPHMVSMEAKAAFTGVPPQQTAELLVMILARLDRWGVRETSRPLESSLPCGFLTGHGVVVAGSEIFFTKLVLTWSYVAWLREGREDTYTGEGAILHATEGYNLMDQARRLKAGEMAVGMLAKIHMDWGDEAEKIASGERVTWDIGSLY